MQPIATACERWRNLHRGTPLALGLTGLLVVCSACRSAANEDAQLQPQATGIPNTSMNASAVQAAPLEPVQTAEAPRLSSSRATSTSTATRVPYSEPIGASTSIPVAQPNDASQPVAEPPQPLVPDDGSDKRAPVAKETSSPQSAP